MLSCILLSAESLAAAPVGAVCSQLGHLLQHLVVLLAVSQGTRSSICWCYLQSSRTFAAARFVLLAISWVTCCSISLCCLQSNSPLHVSASCICLPSCPSCCAACGQLRHCLYLCLIWPCMHLWFCARPEHSSKSNLSSALHEEQVTYATSRLPF